jgi:hypothetical protein
MCITLYSSLADWGHGGFLRLLHITTCFGLLGHRFGSTEPFTLTPYLPQQGQSTRTKQKHQNQNNAYLLIIVEHLFWLPAQDYTQDQSLHQSEKQENNGSTRSSSERHDREQHDL